MQIFLGQAQMRSRPILDKDLVDGIKNFDGSNRLIFGTNTNKKPEPVLVKKLILMLPRRLQDVKRYFSVQVFYLIQRNLDVIVLRCHEPDWNKELIQILDKDSIAMTH